MNYEKDAVLRPPVPDAVYLPHPWDRTSPIHAVVILISAIGLVTTSPSFAASWETSAMRAPGGGLIRIGMTRQEVLKELDQPQRTHASTHNTAAGGKSGKKSGSLTYRGDDGLYNIMFSGERVAQNRGHAQSRLIRKGQGTWLRVWPWSR